MSGNSSFPDIAPAPLARLERAYTQLDTRLVAAAHDYAAAARAPNTIRAYHHDWGDFSRWCAHRGVESLPVDPAHLALYLTDCAQRGLKAATIQRRVASINQAHKAARHRTPSSEPEVRLVLGGIRRTHGTAQVGKAPLLIEDLRAVVRPMTPRRSSRATPAGQHLRELRDRALLLVGFAGAFRRSELVALESADLGFSRSGLVITLRRSKTDQEGAGRTIAIPWGSDPATCPLKALQLWMQAAEISAGPLFRRVGPSGRLSARRLHDRTVARVVKRRVAAVGIDPERYAGHSLRAGLATSAAEADVSESVIAQQTGHKSMEVLRRYIRPANLFKRNAAGALGL